MGRRARGGSCRKRVARSHRGTFVDRAVRRLGWGRARLASPRHHRRDDARDPVRAGDRGTQRERRRLEHFLPGSTRRALRSCRQCHLPRPGPGPERPSRRVFSRIWPGSPGSRSSSSKRPCPTWRPSNRTWPSTRRSGRRESAALELIRAGIPDELPVVIDAKRGDIGSTAARQAVAIADGLGADAVTLSPYLGRDAVEPFLARDDIFIYALCRTSNPTAGEIQGLEVACGSGCRLAGRAALRQGRPYGDPLGGRRPDRVRRRGHRAGELAAIRASCPIARSSSRAWGPRAATSRRRFVRAAPAPVSGGTRPGGGLLVECFARHSGGGRGSRRTGRFGRFFRTNLAGRRRMGGPNACAIVDRAYGGSESHGCAHPRPLDQYGSHLGCLHQDLSNWSSSW